MTELEIRGFIPESQFEKIKSKLTEEFGQPRMKHRLSFVTGDYIHRNLETRLRITNGKFDIAQKVGDVGAVSRQEYEMRFDLPADHILFLFRTAQRLAEQSNDHYAIVLQHENYIFENDEIEVKLYKQFGKEYFYGFEIESKQGDMESIDNFSKKYDLKPGEDYDSDSVIRKRNTEVNIPADEIGDEQLRDLIKQYLLQI